MVSSSGNSGAGFVFAGLGAPIIILLNFMVIVGSVLNFKTLNRFEGVFFVFCAFLLVFAVWYYGGFYFDWWFPFE